MLRFFAGVFALLVACVCLADENPPLLLHQPTISATQIVLVYAGDLWSVPRAGGVAQRLTAGAGTASRPVFSPDGSEIAFTGNYDGNADVYLIPASGGTPRRLTYHPAADEVVGWTRDGKSVLFASERNSYSFSTGFLRFRGKVDFRPNCRCPVALKDRIRRMARSWRTCHWTTRLKSGNGMAADEHRRCGLRGCRIQA